MPIIVGRSFGRTPDRPGRSRWRSESWRTERRPFRSRQAVADGRLGNGGIVGAIADFGTNDCFARRRRPPCNLAGRRATIGIVARRLELHGMPSGFASDLILNFQGVGLEQRIDGQPTGDDLSGGVSSGLKL